MQHFEKSSYLYTSLFCEENIWYLADSLISQGINVTDINILFITNANKEIAFFNQQSTALNKALLWDYHVVLLVKLDNSQYIFDFDTRLPFPSNILYYFHNSLPNNINVPYRSQFRVIPANTYLRQFYSDRNHMKNVIPERLFPSYPAILSADNEKMTLIDLFDIEEKISGTYIFQDMDTLLNWVAEQ